MYPLDLPGEHRLAQKSRIWNEHRDINHVMLADSLMPEGYLELQ
jgi:hypothetical protein